MFTGLVQGIGTIVEATPVDAGCRLRVQHPELFAGVELGASIAVNGCCLTVVERGAGTVAFDAVPETMRRTNLGLCTVGSPVNLERALRVGEELGGHFVSGHIDCSVRLLRRDDAAEWSTFWCEMPLEYAGQIASKGSVALDGVSLTVVDTSVQMFSIALIPHTLAATTLGQRRGGDWLNLETDVLAKYLQRQLECRGGGGR